jgi:hypothetical protein
MQRSSHMREQCGDRSLIRLHKRNAQSSSSQAATASVLHSQEPHIRAQVIYHGPCSVLLKHWALLFGHPEFEKGNQHHIFWLQAPLLSLEDLGCAIAQPLAMPASKQA